MSKTRNENEKKHNREEREQTKNFEKRVFFKHTNRKVKKKDCSFAKDFWCSKGLLFLRILLIS